MIKDTKSLINLSSNDTENFKNNFNDKSILLICNTLVQNLEDKLQIYKLQLEANPSLNKKEIEKLYYDINKLEDELIYTRRKIDNFQVFGMLKYDKRIQKLKNNNNNNNNIIKMKKEEKILLTALNKPKKLISYTKQLEEKKINDKMNLKWKKFKENEKLQKDKYLLDKPKNIIPQIMNPDNYDGITS